MSTTGLLTRLSNAAEFVRDNGPVGFTQELYYRVVNNWYERTLGVRTDGMMRPEELGIHDEDAQAYVPIGYAAIRWALRRVPLVPESVSFVDFGAGKGRGVVVAATFPYRSVVGVELSEPLARLARENVANMRQRRAQSVDVVIQNAIDYRITQDANLFYFFNSFIGATLEAVVRNIVASFETNPRYIYIMYFNKPHFEKLRDEAGYAWIRPVQSAHFYPAYSYRLYEISPDAASERERMRK
jgi:hypothetical protein